MGVAPTIPSTISKVNAFRGAGIRVHSALADEIIRQQREVSELALQYLAGAARDSHPPGLDHVERRLYSGERVPQLMRHATEVQRRLATRLAVVLVLVGRDGRGNAGVEGPVRASATLGRNIQIVAFRHLSNGVAHQAVIAGHQARSIPSCSR